MNGDLTLTPEAASAKIINEKTGIYYFYGEEDYLKRRTVERIVKECVGDDAGFGRADIDLTGSGTLDDMTAELMSPSMMCENKVITVTGFDAEKDSAKTFTAAADCVLSAAGIDVKEKTPLVPADAFAGTVLILISRAPEFTAQKKTVSTAAYKRFCRVFTPVAFDIQPEARLCDWIIRSLRRDGLAINRADAVYLSDRCIDSMYMLRTEMDKLAAVCGETVTRADIDRYVTSAARDIPFALSNAVMKKNAGEMIRLLSAEKARKGEPVVLSAAISACVFDMLRVKYLADGGVSPDRAAQLLGMNSYRAGLYRTAVGSISAKRLEDMALMCYETEIKLKSTQQDPWVLLDVLALAAGSAV